ncbi:MAG: hypothetical protein K2M47_06715 [Clostridiales bacterium]|nr:hypothetical protein [Clostridiales bacterium]
MFGKKNNNRGGNRPHFHCSSKQQEKAIKANYWRRSGKAQTPQQSQPKAKQNVGEQANKAVAARPAFKLPLQDGGHCWNIYKVSNKILNGKQDNDVHGGLVLAEENDNVILVEVTHSPKHTKRNNIPIKNKVSTDKKKDPQTGEELDELQESYLRRKLVVSIETKNGVEGINVRALNNQMNDLQFTDEEKEEILNKLSHLSTAESQYILFKKLATKKNTDT